MPTAASASGFIGRVGLNQPNATSYSSIAKRGQSLQLVNNLLNRSHGSRRLKATLLSLTGAAVGAASKAYSNSRVSAPTNTLVSRTSLGGARTIDTVTYQTGVSVAQDLTTIDTQIAAKHKPATYATDRAGAGGGGRAGKI